MTVWGATPTCRGFDHFDGYYDAAEDHFTHMTGKHLDLRHDFEPNNNSSGIFSSDLFGQRAAAWITATINEGARNTFAYLAFQAIHGPSQVFTIKLYFLQLSLEKLKELQLYF